jgi:hypothetical protein
LKPSTLTRKAPITRTGFKPAEPKPPKGPRKKKCQACKTLFTPFRALEAWCSPECGLIVAKDRLAKQERKVDRERKQALKSRKDWEREAQQAMNQWVREVRDADKPCISCGRWHEGQWHNGHYLSRGARPNLALEESNTAKQCQPCNVHLSGNQVQFRAGLVARIGLQAVEALESDHVPRKYTIEDLQAIRNKYRALVRQAKKEEV